MALETRRSFNRKMLGSLMTYGLIETVFRRDLLADAVKPVVKKWLVELNALSQDLKDQKIKDLDFQTQLENLYKRVDLAELITFIDLDRATKDVKLPDKGAASLGVDLSKVEGLPEHLVFGKQIFALRKGRSIVPHGHDNMCTGFIVLRGDFNGKHYERVADEKDHYLIKPTIDRAFKPGECSTVSDHKDNVHWFKAESDTAFIFNVHIMGYNLDNTNAPNRVYVDPEGEKTKDGLIVAKKISSHECHKKYG
ncbi:MAG TPA: hypothetical protein DDY78_26020 [Planctomycetales bacterium]|jgi:hypothetical protein|nr:hypothetical protein [Planctomycetales bacterium]